MLGLRPWLAFLRRALVFFLEVRFDMEGKANGIGPRPGFRRHGSACAIGPSAAGSGWAAVA